MNFVGRMSIYVDHRCRDSKGWDMFERKRITKFIEGNAVQNYNTSPSYL